MRNLLLLSLIGLWYYSYRKYRILVYLNVPSAIITSVIQLPETEQSNNNSTETQTPHTVPLSIQV